jgi:flagellar protein FliO/FliZ
LKYLVRAYASRPGWQRLPLAALALGACRLASAASELPFAQPDAGSATRAGGAGMLRVMLALLLVLAAVFATAWFVRRVRGLGGAEGTGLEILAQIPLGARERAVLIRVGDRQILIGVAPGNVRTLHLLEANAPAAIESVPASADAALRPTFKSLLLKSLGK